MNTPTLSDQGYRIAKLLVVCTASVFVFFGTYGRSGADPANSRLATVYALTEYGTFYIDRPLDADPIPFEQRTIDKVMVRGERIGDTVHGGRLISSKPPVFPLLMTAEYVLINGVLGWDLERGEDVKRILFTISVTLIGLAYVIALVFFCRTLELFIEDPLTRIVLLVGLAFGTQLWGFSTMLNNHVPAASMLVVSLYLCLALGSGKVAPAAWRFFLFGLTGALVFTFDMPATVFVAIAGLHLLRKFPSKTLLWATAGAVVPLGIHFGVMVAVTGSPLPVQMRGELYHYESSYWRHPRGIDALNEPKLTYLFHMTLGRCGLFSLYPVLLVGAFSAVRALVRKGAVHRGPILAGAVGFAVLTAYYALRTNNYGGEAYGFRWYIVAAPVLLLMGAPLVATVRRRWQWVLLGIMIGISFFSAWECTRTGWRANQEWICHLLGPSY